MSRVALFLCAALFAGSADATLRGSNELAASMQPDVVAHLLAEVEHTWEKTALAALMGKESEANAVQQMQQSCQKVAKSIIDGSEGDKERIMEYMTEVCSANKQEKAVCDEFSAHIDAAVTHDAYHNREEVDLSAFCGSFYQGSVLERAKKQQQVLQAAAAEQKKKEEAKAAEQKKQEEAKAAEQKKQQEAKAHEEAARAQRAKAADQQKNVKTAEKEAEVAATAIKEADVTEAGIEKDGESVQILVERAQKELQTADEKEVAAAEAQAAQAAAEAKAKRAAVMQRKAEEKKKLEEKQAEEKKAEEKKTEEKAEEKKVAAASEKKPVVAALAVHHSHCPKCGSLVCPHGFTAEESEGHCCPYCVNPAISTEVVKDPAYYAEKAAPIYKKFR